MGLYQVEAGSVDNFYGQNLKEGDRVKTKLALDKMFPGKFKRLDLAPSPEAKKVVEVDLDRIAKQESASQKRAKFTNPKPAISEVEVLERSDESTSTNPSSEEETSTEDVEVTEKIKGASNKGVKVIQRGKDFLVFDLEDPDKPLNDAKSLRSLKAVSRFVEEEI